MQRIIAIDAGGTHTRAAIADTDGHCLGVGTAGSGNPTSAGLDAAVAGVVRAVADARAIARIPLDEQLAADRILVAMAGHGTAAPIAAIEAALAASGVCGPVMVESDLLAMFCSGTPSPDGYALVSGTGAAAVRVQGHEAVRSASGTGWMLGDDGSGFWIGRRVARAVVADLDGLGRRTALTPMLLAQVGLERGTAMMDGRPRVLNELIDTLYALRPVQLSRYAPLAFQAGGDAVALQIRETAADRLADLIEAVRDAVVTGPLVLGGSVLTSGILPDPALRARLLRQAAGGADANARDAAPIAAADGIIGAIVLALVRDGIDVDDAVFATITDSLGTVRP